MFTLWLLWSRNKFGNCAACATHFSGKCSIFLQIDYMWLIERPKHLQKARVAIIQKTASSDLLKKSQYSKFTPSEDLGFWISKTSFIWSEWHTIPSMQQQQVLIFSWWLGRGQSLAVLSRLRVKHIDGDTYCQPKNHFALWTIPPARRVRAQPDAGYKIVQL